MLNGRLRPSNKKYIVYFIIEFKILAIKTEINNMHTIFLLKKNIKSNIIKTILGYLSMSHSILAICSNS